MIRKAARWLVMLSAILAVAAPTSVLADDGAASIAAGGLVSRRETRIVMAKEVLKISTKKIVVDYDFRNDSDQDVTTEVAFPIPPYENGVVEGPGQAAQAFESFKLWIDDNPAQYESEAAATLNGKEVSVILRANRIDIPTFGHFDAKEVVTPDFTRLPKAVREQLVQTGLFEPRDANWGKWTVHLQYHWTQTFPAHSTVHIRHEYTPVVGAADDTPIDALQFLLNSGSAKRDAKRWRDSGADEVAAFCPEPDLLRTVIRRVSEVKNDRSVYDGTIFPIQWVDFILTTANTWQRPIEDFTLIVERPEPDSSWRNLVSFCSPENGKVEKLDADHFQVHLTNFVPTSELHIGFFDVPGAKASQPAGKK